MMCDGYDFEGCVRLLGAVIKMELTDARDDPYKVQRIADWLGMSPDEVSARWRDRKNSYSLKYGVKRSDFHDQR